MNLGTGFDLAQKELPIFPKHVQADHHGPQIMSPAPLRGADSAVNVQYSGAVSAGRYQTTRGFTQLLLSRLLRSNEELACCEQIADFSSYTR